MNDARTVLEGVWASVRTAASGYENDPPTLTALKVACLSGYSQAVTHPSGFSAEDINQALAIIILEELKNLVENL